MAASRPSGTGPGPWRPGGTCSGAALAHVGMRSRMGWFGIGTASITRVTTSSAVMSSASAS